MPENYDDSQYGVTLVRCRTFYNGIYATAHGAPHMCLLAQQLRKPAVEHANETIFIHESLVLCSISAMMGAPDQAIL